MTPSKPNQPPKSPSNPPAFGSGTPRRGFAPPPSPSLSGRRAFVRMWSELPAINQTFFVLGSGSLGLFLLLVAGPPTKAAADGALYPYTSEGKRESCLNNLRAIAQAVALYANDYEGHLPPHDGKQSLSLASTLNVEPKLWQCPTGETIGNENAQGTGSYGLNPVLLRQSIGEVDDAGQTLLLADRADVGLGLRPPFPTFAGRDVNVALRHDNAAGAVYADGHAGTLTGSSDWNTPEAWGGSALFRAALSNLEAQSPRSKTWLALLRKGEVAKAGAMLKASGRELSSVRDAIADLWLQNTGGSASASLDALGWHLVRASEAAGEKGVRTRFDAEMSRRVEVELEAAKAAPRKLWTLGEAAQIELPETWTSEEKRDGRYTRLFIRSRLKDVFALLEVGNRDTYSQDLPIDWAGAERDLRRRYGAQGYKRLKLETGWLDGRVAGIWEYELERPGSPRLRKRFAGYVSGYGSVTKAFTAPAKNWKGWPVPF